MAAKGKTLTIRIHRGSWRLWRKVALERKISLTKLLELAMDKELSTSNLEKQASAQARS